MVEKQLGSGIALDQNFDFEIDATGDLNSVSGVEELNKDLALRLTIFLDEFRGQILTNEVKSEIKNRVINVLLSDQRVVNVNEASIQIKEVTRNEIAIKAPYKATTGQTELIFTLE